MRAPLIVVWLLLGGILAAQAADAPSFEVVAIKRNVAGEQAASSIVQPGDRYVATNMTLRMLVKTASGVHDDQIAGRPGWIDEGRYPASTGPGPTSHSYNTGAKHPFFRQ